MADSNISDNICIIFNAKTFALYLMNKYTTEKSGYRRSSISHI